MAVRILTGDCHELLRTLPDESVHCCVTSPPYFGLRDYGVDGQMGLEQTPDEFIAGMVAVFREVHRVLRGDGTLWLNIGDSYAGSWGSQGRQGNTGQMAGRAVADARVKSKILAAQIAAHPKLMQRTGAIRQEGVKPKDLYGIPWMLAFALRADGWYLRQDIIWSKPNPMPESVRDRCTKAHEYLFLLSKSERYYYDADAIAEPLAPASVERLSQVNLPNQAGSYRVPGKTNGAMKAVSKYRNADGTLTEGYETKGGTSGDLDGTLARMGEKGTRNKRSVWEVATMPFKEAHFATFPPALIEPCIKAGCPVGGTVLDPFGGAGTTGLVADRLQRSALLIEINPEYADMARRRIQEDAGIFADVSA